MRNIKHIPISIIQPFLYLHKTSDRTDRFNVFNGCLTLTVRETRSKNHISFALEFKTFYFQKKSYDITATNWYQDLVYLFLHFSQTQHLVPYVD